MRIEGVEIAAVQRMTDTKNGNPRWALSTRGHGYLRLAEDTQFSLQDIDQFEGQTVVLGTDCHGKVQWIETQEGTT